MLRFATADGTQSGRIVSLSLNRYRWPTRCGKLFEYASGEESGWIVHPTPRSAPRFVRFPVGGQTRCDTYSDDPCELARRLVLQVERETTYALAVRRGWTSPSAGQGR
jgi:hypothetical protein